MPHGLSIRCHNRRCSAVILSSPFSRRATSLSQFCSRLAAICFQFSLGLSRTGNPVLSVGLPLYIEAHIHKPPVRQARVLPANGIAIQAHEPSSPDRDAGARPRKRRTSGGRPRVDRLVSRSGDLFPRGKDSPRSCFRRLRCLLRVCCWCRLRRWRRRFRRGQCGANQQIQDHRHGERAETSRWGRGEDAAHHTDLDVCRPQYSSPIFRS